MKQRLFSGAQVPWLAVVVVAAAIALRVAVIDRQGLWVDEVFSLALATGHSLEHPAAVADPVLGDFTERARPVPSAAFGTYAEHETPAAGVSRVVRAVRLSDTSPPLYYVLLNGWTRWFGTGDVALRTFSLLCAVACFPLLWWLAIQIGGATAAVPALMLFGFAPAAVWYSIEGRMYSLVWLLVIATACLCVRLHATGFKYYTFGALIAVSLAGLLTHYFYLFAWGGMLVWLLWRPGKLDRHWVLLVFGASSLLALPWYATALSDSQNWRVSAGWQNIKPRGYRPIAAPFELLASFFGNRPPDRVALPAMRWVAPAIASLVAVLWVIDRRIFEGRRLLLWLWAVAASIGPLAFDLAHGSYTSAVTRYALGGMPAVFLLAGIVAAGLPGRVRVAALLAITVAWLPGLSRISSDFARGTSPLREVALLVDERSRGGDDLIVVHSIPSGIVGVARYLATPRPMMVRVGQLQRPVEGSELDSLFAEQRIFLVKVRAGGGVAPHEERLRRTATLVAETSIRNATVLEFAPATSLAGPLLSVGHPEDPK